MIVGLACGLTFQCPMNATRSKIVRGRDGTFSVPRKYVFEIWKKNLHNPHHHPRSTQPPSHKSHQHLTLTKESKRQASLLPAMFGREGISYFREITQLIQINPITLSLYDPTAKISDHTFLVFYPTIWGEIPLFYYYIIIPLLLFLSSPRSSDMVDRFYRGSAMSTREPLHDQRKNLFY